jgi:AcrR family transcriptional regulator
MSSMEDDTTLIWLRPEPTGRKPRFTREQIARAALRIADDEGFEAVTMKRIASELGAGTMTLYYYVRTKADIVALMQDAILEDVLIPDGELPAGWKAAVAVIARRTREVLIQHPWAISALNQAQFGPNAVRHFEQSLAALKQTHLTPTQKAELTAIVDDYVTGSAIHTIELLERVRSATDHPQLVKDAQVYGETLMARGSFPEVHALAASAGGAFISHDVRRDGQFETGLAALLDGLERRYQFA